jgi:hypothetical protein
MASLFVNTSVPKGQSIYVGYDVTGGGSSVRWAKGFALALI